MGLDGEQISTMRVLGVMAASSCAAPAALAKAVTKLQGQYTSGASSIAQKAAEAAYDGPHAVAMRRMDSRMLSSDVA